MAQLVITNLIDDLNGSSDDVETVRFGLDGTDFEIDLNPKNADALRKALEKFTAKARVVAKARVRRERRVYNSPRPSTPDTAKAARAWAIDQGLTVPSRGRLPRDTVEAYLAATNGGTANGNGVAAGPAKASRAAKVR